MEMNTRSKTLELMNDPVNPFAQSDSLVRARLRAAEHPQEIANLFIAYLEVLANATDPVDSFDVEIARTSVECFAFMCEDEFRPGGTRFKTECSYIPDQDLYCIYFISTSEVRHHFTIRAHNSLVPRAGRLIS